MNLIEYFTGVFIGLLPVVFIELRQVFSKKH